MTLKQSLSSELPYLRRYARAITGSQQLGDAAVREVLEALLTAPHIFDDRHSVRPELYRAFHRLWQPASGQGQQTSAPTSNLSLRARQALMLNSVEGFSLREVGEILGETPETIAQDLEDARAKIAAQLVSDVLIIEDEAIIALHIKSIVGGMGHKVVGISRTHAEAVRMARETKPELVLADISLADGSSGIDAVREILEEIDVPVVFITAFPERLLTGERLEPTYLITKPFEPAVLTATIAQALMFHREAAGLAEAVSA